MPAHQANKLVHQLLMSCSVPITLGEGYRLASQMCALTVHALITEPIATFFQREEDYGTAIVYDSDGFPDVRLWSSRSVFAVDMMTSLLDQL
jgi:hypothetical protein